MSTPFFYHYDPNKDEDLLVEWLEVDKTFLAQREEDWQKLRNMVPSKTKSNFFMSLKEKYLLLVNSITKNAIIATIIMLLALSTVGVSAAELFAPKEFKPSTQVYNLFAANKQKETNPYTALKPDKDNDVVLFEACDLAIKYPKELAGQKIRAEYSGNSEFMPENTVKDTINPHSNLNGGFTNQKEVSLLTDTTYSDDLKPNQTKILGFSVACQTPGHILENLDKEEYEKQRSFEGWQKISKEQLRQQVGWFLTEAELKDIYQTEMMDKRFIVRFIYNSQEYNIGYFMEESEAENESIGLFGNQVQLQFNSLVKSQTSAEIVYPSQKKQLTTEQQESTQQKENLETKILVWVGEKDGYTFFKDSEKTDNVYYTKISRPEWQQRQIGDALSKFEVIAKFKLNPQVFSLLGEQLKANFEISEIQKVQIITDTANSTANSDSKLTTKILTFKGQSSSGELNFVDEQNQQYTIVNIDQTAPIKPPVGGWLDVRTVGTKYKVTGNFQQESGWYIIEAVKVEKVENSNESKDLLVLEGVEFIFIEMDKDGTALLKKPNPDGYYSLQAKNLEAKKINLLGQTYKIWGKLQGMNIVEVTKVEEIT